MRYYYKREKGRFTYHAPTAKNALKFKNRYSKLNVLEGIIANFVTRIKKAAPRFEGGDKLEKLCYNKGS